MRRRFEKVHAARVVEGTRVALEALGETPVRDGGVTGRGPRVLRDEAIGMLPLGDVEARARCALHALREDAGHEEGVVAAVAPHRHLVLGADVWWVGLPRRVGRGPRVD